MFDDNSRGGMYMNKSSIIKTPSGAFLNIRNKIRSKMKEQNVSYSDIIKSMDKENRN
jgi:hypothetical protein